jgi:hypothetical protein
MSPEEANRHRLSTEFLKKIVEGYVTTRLIEQLDIFSYLITVIKNFLLFLEVLIC